MELENELGKQIFLRGRRIILTKEGMILRKRAEEIVSLMEKTKAEVSSSDESICGDIYIGGGETEGKQSGRYKSAILISGSAFSAETAMM